MLATSQSLALVGLKMERDFKGAEDGALRLDVGLVWKNDAPLGVGVNIQRDTRKSWFGAEHPSDQQHAWHTRWCQWKVQNQVFSACMKLQQEQEEMSLSERTRVTPATGVCARHWEEGNQSLPNHQTTLSCHVFSILANMLTFAFDSL